MYKLSISNRANRDLENIVSYISVELGNPAAVTDFVEEVIKCYECLETTPMIYPYLQMFNSEIKGYREAPIKTSF